MAIGIVEESKYRMQFKAIANKREKRRRLNDRWLYYEYQQYFANSYDMLLKEFYLWNEWNNYQLEVVEE
jgi:hypothetical protein